MIEFIIYGYNCWSHTSFCFALLWNCEVLQSQLLFYGTSQISFERHVFIKSAPQNTNQSYISFNSISNVWAMLNLGNVHTSGIELLFYVCLQTSTNKKKPDAGIAERQRGKIK